MSQNHEVDLDKPSFTTFEIAEICGANVTSVKTWIREEDDEVAQFHETPGGHKRLAREQLIDFLNKHDMPNPFAERRRKHVLAVCEEPAWEGRLQEQFGAVHEYDATDDPAYGLLRIGQWRPDAVVVDATIEGIDPVALCEGCQAILDLRPVDIVVIHDGDPSDAEALSEAGATYVVEKSDGDGTVFDAVRRILL